METPKDKRIPNRNTTFWKVVLGIPVVLICMFIIVSMLGVIGLFVGATDLTNAACATDPGGTIVAPPNELLLDKGLITGKTCGAPCWQDITPGETAYEDALAILKTSPLVRAGSLDIQPETIWWGSAYYTSGQLNWMTFSGGSAQKIHTHLDYPLTAGQLIEIFGDPDYIGLSPYVYPDATAPPCDSATLVWMSRGIEVELQDVDERKVAADDPLVGSESVAESVTYFEPTETIEELVRLRHSAFWQKETYQPWDGYDAIERPSR